MVEDVKQRGGSRTSKEHAFWPNRAPNRLGLQVKALLHAAS
jgi:hypothetical protein